MAVTVVVAAMPKMGLTGVAGSDGAGVASFPNVDPVEEGVPKTGVEDSLGDSLILVSAKDADVPNLIGPVQNTGADDAEVDGVPKVKPVEEGVPDPVPRGTEVPNAGVDVAKGVFVPKEKLLDAGDPPKVKPPETLATPNFDAKLGGAAEAEASAGAFGFGVLQQGQMLISPPLRV